jgi:exopolysaccharide production protein ExoZ
MGRQADGPAAAGDRSPGHDTIIAIQALRALAATAVVVAHFQFDLGRIMDARDALPDLTVGHAGVDLFFVISGFVMVYASEPMFGRAGGPASFLARRAIRIVPLYWLATTLYLALALTIPTFEKSYSAASVVGSYLFIPLPRLDGTMQPLVGQGWTLNYEMFFYVIFGAAVVAPRRMAVALVSAVLIAGVLAARIFQPASPTVAFWLDPIILEFVFGMAIGLAYREGVRLPKPLALLAIAAGFALMMIAHRYTDARVLFWGLPAAIIVAGAAFGDFSMRSAAWRPVAVIGDSSYALYLFHSIPVRAVLLLCAWTGLDAASRPTLYLAAALIGATALAVAIYYLFERPVTQLLRRQMLPPGRGQTVEKPVGLGVPASDINTLGVK